MGETHTVHDPFLNKAVQVSSRLTDRLRGKYAVGPTLPSGEPEFGWRQHETPPIQHEAAAEIERLQATLGIWQRQFYELKAQLERANDPTWPRDVQSPPEREYDPDVAPCDDAEFGMKL